MVFKYKSPLDDKVKYEITEFLKGRYLKANGEVDSMLGVLPFKSPETGYREMMANKIMEEISHIFIKNNLTNSKELRDNIHESLSA